MAVILQSLKNFDTGKYLATVTEDAVKPIHTYFGRTPHSGRREPSAATSGNR